MNFSEYCRQVLMDYKPKMPDTLFRDELFAARKDIVNFINNIKGLKMGSEERKEFLRSMPVIQQWWKRLWFPLLVLLFFVCSIGLMVWLNLREYRIPKY